MSYKNQFILVHDADTNKPIVINNLHIKCILKQADTRKTTRIVVSTETKASTQKYTYITVNETPEKLYKNLAGFPFIKLHLNHDNSVIVFPIFDIGYISETVSMNNNVTNIQVNSLNYYVNESPEKIYDIIKQYYNNA